MSRRIIIAVLFVGALLAVRAQGAPAGARAPIGGGRSVGAPKTFRNLALFPIYDAGARPGPAYRTLDEALKARQVQIREKGGGGEVNTLLVTNRGTRPVYIMAGEVLLGGQQDRCLAKDAVIPPGKRDVPVPVFCVEHGRWAGRAEFGESAKMVAGADIRASAQKGGYAASMPAVASPRAATQTSGRVVAQTQHRPAAVAEVQQEVWDKVARKNRAHGAESSTGTYRAVANLAAGGEASRNTSAYLKAFARGLGVDKKLVGVAVAIDGRVVAADVFGDPALFRKLWPKLLRSYATDAAETAGKKGAAPAAPRVATVRAFLARASDARTRTAGRPAGANDTVRLESKDAVTYRLTEGGAAGGRVVHESAFRK